MRELLVIRHGQSQHHLDGRTGGWTDSSLTDLGRAQAGATGAFLRDHPPFPLSAIVSSDLARASETAAIIGAAVGLDVELAPALRELNNGVAAGLTVEEARRLETPFQEPALDWAPFPKGESWRELYSRMSLCLSTLRASGRDRLVLVSHTNAIICAINWVLGLDSDRQLRDLMYEIRPCSLTHLRIGGDGSRTVVRLNDTAHLSSR
ncbi:histidine phosphatase family protein [Phenylobacterium aquaticum]|uniref:histidine phosphatase family protein n=1 Tax=Phenylobacterium aquaticum TaxID=1763816 RepID=UPI0026E932F4|nr:histidine phosphatase family protein [Phenylobacterium aquaticum]